MRALLIWQASQCCLFHWEGTKRLQDVAMEGIFEGTKKVPFFLQRCSKLAQLLFQTWTKWGVQEERAAGHAKVAGSSIWTRRISDKSSVTRPLMPPLSESYHKGMTLHWRNLSFTVNETTAQIKHLSDYTHTAIRTPIYDVKSKLKGFGSSCISAWMWPQKGACRLAM